MATQQLTNEQIYNKNKKRAKFLKRLAPICFWSLLGISILCLVLAIRYSVGNVVEIVTMLDNRVYNGEQLEANYLYLIDKFGEIVIGNGGMGFQIKFVNIGNALFSKLFVFYFLVFGILLVGAYVVGKWALPHWAEQISERNQDLVNLTVLRSQENDKE